MTDQLAKRKPNELRDLIEGQDFRAQLLKALPKAMTPERFVRITVTAMMRNPKLMQCTRETFFRCILDLAAIGLEPDGRQAHLIPRKSKQQGTVNCTLIVGYQGLKELLYRNGDILSEHSDVVGDMDTFDFEFGSNKHLHHKPNIHSRGKVFAAYSHIKLPRGDETFDVMNVEEIEAIRRRSSSPNEGPWVTDWAEMAKKTVFRRLSKGLPLSPRTRDAIELDQTYDTIEATPVPIKSAVVGGRGQGRAFSIESSSGTENNGEPEGSDETIPPEDHAAPEPQEAAPPEPVAAERPEGPLVTIRRRLKESGFTADELLHVLKIVQLVDSKVKELSQSPARALNIALSDWDNCVDRLKQEYPRDAGKPVQEDFPV